MLIKPTRALLRSICYVKDSDGNGIDRNSRGENYALMYRQSLIPNPMGKHSIVVFEWNSSAQCLPNGATFIRSDNGLNTAPDRNFNESI
ncbi:MAG: hypothetical protein DLM68_02900 [Hyphomicrobiales bacterium]|nr:MAG: hypothetical protein DLM68_02900 [Hyphomicrobiales bacterium]